MPFLDEEQFQKDVKSGKYSYARLKDSHNISASTIKRRIREMRAAGFLNPRKRGRNRGDVYGEGSRGKVNQVSASSAREPVVVHNHVYLNNASAPVAPQITQPEPNASTQRENKTSSFSSADQETLPGSPAGESFLEKKRREAKAAKHKNKTNVDTLSTLTL